MTRWFGQPWPKDWRVNGRAPVCEDDADHIDTPIGEECIYCFDKIEEDDQGIGTPYLQALRNPGYQVVYYHLRCFLTSIGIGDLAKLY